MKLSKASWLPIVIGWGCVFSSCASDAAAPTPTIGSVAPPAAHSSSVSDFCSDGQTLLDALHVQQNLTSTAMIAEANGAVIDAYNRLATSAPAGEGEKFTAVGEWYQRIDDAEAIFDYQGTTGDPEYLQAVSSGPTTEITATETLLKSSCGLPFGTIGG